MPFKPIEVPKCPKCGKSVYAAEEMVAGGYKWHKFCFKCSMCNKLLDSTNVAEHGAQLFCKTCHCRRHGPKGVGFGLGAGTLTTDLGHELYDTATQVKTPCRRRITDVTDGTTNTFLLAEVAGRNRRFVMGRERTGSAFAWTAGPWANPDARIAIGGFNPTWQEGQPLPANGPCAVNCINDKEIYSFHTGGANAVMGDGSVRFLKASMSLLQAYQHLTRARGEVIPAD